MMSCYGWSHNVFEGNVFEDEGAFVWHSLPGCDPLV